MTFKDSILFRTRRFRADLRYTHNFIGLQNVDELALIDIGEDRQAFFRAVEQVTEHAFVPVTIGGGVHTREDIRTLMGLGADKVIVGRALWENPDEVGAMAAKYGRQAIVAAVDDHEGKARHCGLPTVDAAVRAQDLGCGEILLQSVERDGSLSGYDMKTLKAVCEATEVPVIACSGCGTWAHMADAFTVGASAAATTVIFHFADAALAKCKGFLQSKGLEVRAA